MDDSPKGYVTSREWYIDQELREIVGRLVRGKETPEDRSQMQNLIAERSRRMMPSRRNDYGLQRRRSDRVLR
jgi:hypothetical protein